MSAFWKITALAAAGCLSVSIAGTSANAAELTAVAGAGPLPELMGALIPVFERTSGNKVKISFIAAPALSAQIKDGTADFAVTNSEVVDDFVKAGTVRADGNAKIFLSRIGIAVREGAPKPNISTPEALKAALIAAKSVAYSQGASGQHFLTVIARLGLADVLKPKTVVVQGRPVGAAIASGEAEIGIQQVAELMPVPGITLIGEMPGDLQKIIPYSIGVSAKAKETEAAKAMAKFLSSEAAMSVYKPKGMNPPG